ncbi:outer membrane beta-barrel family protein [Mucilaginibacter sp. OK098]|uniref:outer membrane beta-barrel family protein n=1 Tax=Mucilaginibacter sp. OK098 TaxID=1855297 RepID=UPI00092366C3|nr:outer membrane beta-barrel family protein [Mucilaginibacter sp. OK098]SHL88780.1 Outer membrane receptor proteins, mostly Fe transport [Mucilaginibacter sp. OK098]
MQNVYLIPFIKKTACMGVLLLFCAGVYCQPKTENAHNFSLVVVNEKLQPADGATVKLLKDNKLLKTVVTNASGMASFVSIQRGSYTFLVSSTGYKPQTSRVYHFPADVITDTIKLQPSTTNLQQVDVTAHAPVIEMKQGKMVVNVDASVTNAGSTVLEVLEKSPGVTVDRNGGISLQGKAGVLVTIDDKPTYLSGADLNNLLSSMSSSQVSQIELIANPTAKYDASGNAGIINIKTKKNRQKGFNGSFTTSVGQGVYPKNNNSLVLNYRIGKINTFFNYNFNYVEYLTNLYALRKYYDDNGAVTAMLRQPSFFSGKFFNNTIKTGLDYYISPKTTIGIVLSGTSIHRYGNNLATATWLDPAGTVDSAIATGNKNDNKFKNGAINLNLRHTLSASQDLAVDLDYLHYSLNTKQDFNNELLTPGGYQDESRGNIPTTIKIASGKVDYTLKLGENGTLQSGVKSSYSNTDNLAAYQNFEGGQWVDDNTKSNHFLYKENINALYSSIEKKYGKLTLQGGVRYEYTSYKANQLGNAVQKDSAFSRNYGEFFPSGYVSYQADSSHSFTLTAGRRIDRPVFQNLNPFYFIINKYTYETGNPYLLPQFSWNFELSHQYKNLLTTSVSYSNIQNYFSQLFLNDAAKGILLYTQGNVGHTYNIGVSQAVSVSPLNWWSLTAQATFNHKQLRGFNGNNYTSEINQLNISANNQFTIAKTYTAEISGFYTTRARNDVQELLYPTGQLSAGIARPVLKKKGTLKFSLRDILYTNAMEGFTSFPNATEYFKIKRDSRVFTLTFTYRFGKTYKTVKRTDGSASEEMERVGNG